MSSHRMLTIAIFTGVFAVVGGLAMSAQDKYHAESTKWSRVL